MTEMPVDPHNKQRVIQLNFCGEICELWADGALYLPRYKTLVVSDLHFEKGHAQSTAAPLPRYDTDMTLSRLSEIVYKSNPQRCIFLGDSFHNAEVAKRLPEAYRRILDDLSKGRSFVWIQGNHDSELPTFLPGKVYSDFALNGLYFTHQVTAETKQRIGLISGHYHPKARVNLKLRRISAPCFIEDSKHLIMPAFGTFTGGLNVLNKAIQSVLTSPQSAYICHAGKIYHLPVTTQFFLKN